MSQHCVKIATLGSCLMAAAVGCEPCVGVLCEPTRHSCGDVSTARGLSSSCRWRLLSPTLDHSLIVPFSAWRLYVAGHFICLIPDDGMDCIFIY